MILLLRRHRAADGFEPGPGTRATQEKIELAHPFEPRRPALSAPNQRMAEQRQQRHRRGTGCGDLSQLQQHTPGGGLRQRAACRVVGGNAPALEMGHKPLGKIAVRRDHGDPLLRHHQSFAHQHGNCLRFLFRMRRFHEADA